ncbi:hypothetical protein H8784_07910 [Parabacteroides acidifaciens]|nr:hypothetical protein [Parabacteroides acidifaciens]MBC8601646.1 hypothetical protein [Parabacteroides acidifaciens]
MIQDKIISNRVQQAINIISYFNNKPEAWKYLDEVSFPLYAEYSEILGCFSLVEFPKHVISANKAKVCYDQWIEHFHKLDSDLAKQFSEYWMPVTDNFIEDMVFIDLSNDELSLLLLGCTTNYFAKIAYPSLIRFVEEYQKKDLEEVVSAGVRENSYENNCNVIIAFEEAWNKKDVSIIEPYLVPDFTYSSQWVLEEMKGKDKYLNYLAVKFNTIIQTGSVVKVNAIPNKKGIYLVQDNNRPVIIAIKVHHGMAYRADMCFSDLYVLENLQE